jgi:ABC-type glutathione transport system ATPase component
MIRWLLIGVVVLWSLAALLLVAARWVDPPTTAVHLQRRVQAWMHRTPYREHYEFVPFNQISPDLQHAVIAAEDARFYQHHGFDWQALQLAAQEDMEGGRTRGGSTLTQQLVKNLFFPRRVNLLIVEIENLTKIYESKLRVVAVDGIDLELKQGEIFGLLGPNGAGKTTTISIATTRTLPTSGTVRIAGIDVVSIRPMRGGTSAWCRSSTRWTAR